MADKAKTLLQRLHLKPSTTLKVSKTAIFILLGLISVQTVVGGLLWYADKIKAAGGISQVNTVATLTNFGLSTTVDSSGNRYVMQFDGYIRKYNSSGTFQQQWGGRGSAMSKEEYVPGQFYSGEVGYYIAAGLSNSLYATNVDHIEQFTTTGGHTRSWALPDNLWASGITTDSAGYVYVVTGLQGWEGAVTGVPEILKYSPIGQLEARWGSAGTGNGQFSAANGLALATDSSNNVYVVDGGNYRVQKFNSSGAYQTQWGTQGTNPGQLAGPLAITVNSANQVYVLDVEGGGVAIEKFSNTGTYLTRADLGANPTVISIAAESGNYLVGTNINPNNSVSQLVRIQDTTTLSIDTTTLPAGTSWQNYGGYAVSTSGRQGDVTLSVISGSLPPGMTFGPYTAVDPNNGLIEGIPTAAGSYTFTVQAQDAVSTTTQQLTLVVAQGTPPRRVVTTGATNIGPTSATLEGTTNELATATERGVAYDLQANGFGNNVLDSTDPVGYSYTHKLDLNYVDGRVMSVATDADGYVYAVDYGGNKVYKYGPTGDYIATIAGPGSGNGQVSYPWSIAIDTNGYLYVAENGNNRIQKMSKNGTYLGSWSTAGVTEGAFEHISAMTLGLNNEVYVADSRNGHYGTRIHKFDAAGNHLLSWGSYGASDGQINDVSAMDVDSQGRVFVANRGNNRVEIFSPNGAFDSNWGQPGYGANQIDYLVGISIDSQDNVYLASNGERIRKFTNDGTLITRIGQGSFQGGFFWNLSGVWVAPDDTIYTTQQGQSTNHVGFAPDDIYHFSPSIKVEVSGLTCETEYHYYAYAGSSANGYQSGSAVTFTTGACPDTPINIATTSLADGSVGADYQDLVDTEYATGGVTYTVTSGALPDGLNFNSSTGYITGNPTVEGTFNFEITVEDSNSTDTQALSIDVSAYQAPLQITTLALPDVVHSQPCCLPYSENVYSQGSVGDVTYSVVAGTMPPGLSLQALGNTSVSVAGNPTTPGTYTFTIQAQDSRGNGPGGTDTQEYMIVVPDFPSLAIDTTTLPNGRVDAPYDVTIQYSNYVTQPVFSIVSGSLPDGISLTLNGYLEGTPTVAGTYTFTIQAQDIRPGGGDTDTQELTLVVDPAPPPRVNTPFVTITSPGNNATFVGGASTITGTGPASKTISVFVDNAQIGTATVDSQGSWTYQAQNIAPGSHTLDAKWVPGSDVAFIPYADMGDYSSSVRVIDTATKQIIKNIYLPEGSAAMAATINHAGTKLYVSGKDGFTTLPTAWEIDVQTGMQVRQLTINAPGTWFGAMVVSPDDQVAYVGMADIGHPAAFLSGAKVLLSNFTLDGTFGIATSNQQAELSSTGFSQFSLALSGNMVYSPLSTTDNDDLKTVTAVNVSTLEATSIQILEGPRWEANMPLVAAAGASVYYVGNNKLVQLNPNTNLAIRTITIPGIQEGLVPTDSLVVNPEETKAYIGGVDKIYIVDLATELVTEVPITGYYSPGLGLTSDGAKLYIVGVYGSVEVLNTATGQLEPGPHPFIPANSVSYSLGSFIAPITPPKDSIAFSVPNGSTPTCEQQGNCPQTCEQLGNCPRPPTCQETNTCPKVDCTTTNTCPTVTPTTPPTTSVVPKIISTQFPTPGATPSTSRLGWLDRTALAVARFVPQQAAIGFPYVLFVLLLCFALSLYYQSSNEIRKDKLNRDFLAKRKSIRAQQDNFIALASHYLNTPITIIQGGVELEEGKRKK